MKSEFRRGGGGNADSILLTRLFLSFRENFCSLSRFLDRVRLVKWNILGCLDFSFDILARADRSILFREREIIFSIKLSNQ